MGASRVAALYDIHGNLPALEAVLRALDAAGAERVVVGGDVVPGPMPSEVIRLLQDLELPVRCIRGNGEREVLARFSGEDREDLPDGVEEVIGWVAERLPPGQAETLASWPATLTLDVPSLGPVLFCHATPRDDNELFTRITPERRLLPVFEPVRERLVICGHTHMQFDRAVGETRVVNAGSVGMPFGEPGAYWVLLGPGVELRRTRYDLEDAAERIRATDYPQASEFAAGNVLEPPSEAEMLEIFEPGALG